MKLIYNESMTDKPNIPISKVERDSNLFVWFMTLVIIGLYFISLNEDPSLKQPLALIPFTALVIIHIALHWQLGNIIKRSNKTIWYVVTQGILAFLISWMANEGMALALFMALIGEAVGLFGFSRQGLFAGVYYLILLVVALSQSSTWGSPGLIVIGTIPMVIFVVIYVTLYMRQNEAREQAQALATELHSDACKA